MSIPIVQSIFLSGWIGILYFFTFFLMHDDIRLIWKQKAASFFKGHFLFLLITITSLFITLLSLYKDASFYYALFLFLSALTIITISDLYTMLIPTIISLGFIPIGLCLAWFEKGIVSFASGIMGGLISYCALSLFSYLFEKKSGKQGVGEGDLDLIALIGTFTGPYGAWASLTIGSIIGSLIGFFYIFKEHSFQQAPFPFAPLLALGSCIYLGYIYNMQLFILMHF